MRTITDAETAQWIHVLNRSRPGLEWDQEWRVIAATPRVNSIFFITSDQNIRYQQNLAGRCIAILELSTNDIGRIQAASSLIQDAIDRIQSNDFKQLIIP